MLRAGMVDTGWRSTSSPVPTSAPGHRDGRATSPRPRSSPAPRRRCRIPHRALPGAAGHRGAHHRRAGAPGDRRAARRLELVRARPRPQGHSSPLTGEPSVAELRALARHAAQRPGALPAPDVPRPRRRTAAGRARAHLQGRGRPAAPRPATRLARAGVRGRAWAARLTPATMSRKASSKTPHRPPEDAAQPENTSRQPKAETGKARKPLIAPGLPCPGLAGARSGAVTPKPWRWRTPSRNAKTFR
jgi:hypothetical protein